MKIDLPQALVLLRREDRGQGLLHFFVEFLLKRLEVCLPLLFFKGHLRQPLAVVLRDLLVGQLDLFDLLLGEFQVFLHARLLQQH